MPHSTFLPLSVIPVLPDRNMDLNHFQFEVWHLPPCKEQNLQTNLKLLLHLQGYVFQEGAGL